LEYLEICNKTTLEILSPNENFNQGIILIAAYVGSVRLIDNIELV
jgi:pantothenate synthetase